MDFSEIKKDDKVLIHAGVDGVGNFAIQIAKSFGAYVATIASSKNEEFVKSLGADRVIDYKKEDFSEILHDFVIVFGMSTLNQTTFLRAKFLYATGLK